MVGLDLSQQIFARHGRRHRDAKKLQNGRSHIGKNAAGLEIYKGVVHARAAQGRMHDNKGDGV